MIFRLLILLCLLSGVVNSHTTQLIAQSNFGSLQLKHGAIHLQKDLLYFHQHRQEYAAVAYKGVYYLVLQFESIPDADLKKNLNFRNIRLLQYLGDRAYLAQLPTKISLAELETLSIQAIEPYQKAWKHDPRVPDQLPEWAIPRPDWGDLTVLFQEGTDFAETIQQVEEIEEAQVLFRYEAGYLIHLRLPLDAVDQLISLPSIGYVEPIDPPAEVENHEARILTRSNALAGQTHAGLPMNGAGVDIAIGDDGGIGPHIDFHNRLAGIHTTYAGGTHGDHVAGTILGAGNLDPRHQGFAYGASLHTFSYWDAMYSFPNSYTESDIRITSQSLGNGCNTGYNSLAQLVDRQAVLHDGLMHVFSAGNSGGSSCGGLAGGWRTITGGIKSGKNVLAVGAVDDNGNILSFSSKGPATDGRIKPDICAVGLSVASTRPDNTYGISHGTSMACPGVSGTLAQLYQVYRSLNNGSEPTGGLMKAILLNSATDKGNSGPDLSYGWGVINARAAYRCLEEHRYFSASVNHGETNRHELVIPAGTQRAKIMVYWTDPEAALNASSALINDLDVVVEDAGATVYDPWLMDPGDTPTPQSCYAPALKGADHRNNMEQVEIILPTGGVYSLHVSGTQVPDGPQSYVVVYEWIQDEIHLTYPSGGESWVPGEIEKLQWDAEGNSGFFALEYSPDKGDSWQPIVSIGGSARSYNFTVPSGVTSEGMIRISRSGKEGVSGTPFSIMPVPANLQLTELCRGVLQLDWDAAVGAVGYEIYQLGEQYMETIGETNSSSFEIHGLEPDSTYWLSVQAIGPDGAKSRRAHAISFTPIGQGACSFSAIGLRQLLTPVSGACTALPLSPQIRVENIGPSSASGVGISYQLDNESPVSETLPTLGSADKIDFTFSHQFTTLLPGTHTLKIWVNNSDGYILDDTLIEEFEFVPLVSQYPYLEDFEQSNGGWSSSGKNSSWEWGTPTASQISESASGNKAWGTRLDLDHMNNEYSYLESPCFDLSGFGSNPIFSFSLVYELEEDVDVAWLEYTEDGSSWSKMGSAGTGGFNWYSASGQWSGMTQQHIWRMASCPIPVQSMGDASQVRFRFVLQSSGITSSEGVVIDDVHIHSSEEIYAGPSQENISQLVEGSAWVPFYHNGELIASVHPLGQNLGTVNLNTYQNNGLIRQFNGRYYLNRSWVITPQTQPASPVKLRLYYADSEVWELYSANYCASCEGILHPYRLGISKYHGTNEDDDVSNSTDPGFVFLSGEEVKIVPFSSGYYLETTLSSFSEMWANGGGALGNTGNFPVEWLEFRVQQARGGALLEWSTASELQNNGFSIEVAFENGLFQQMAFVPGAGTTTEIRQYEYHVADLQEGQYQFRLKQIDLDGRFAYSEIRELEIVARNDMMVFPNPFDTYLLITLQSREQQPVSLHLFDPLGRELLVNHLLPFSGGQTRRLDLPPQLKTGLYFFQVRMGEQTYGRRLWRK
ncbi:MAG: S8 family serine peptidase [Bacteroidota bacterium]